MLPLSAGSILISFTDTSSLVNGEPVSPEVEEDGKTFNANARKKAIEIHQMPAT